ncbi:MAG: hypothetical protein IJK92_07100 [Bacteroidales bacterium]|nr:hypothetical protein [Bacteroidales bacterium]
MLLPILIIVALLGAPTFFPLEEFGDYGEIGEIKKLFFRDATWHVSKEQR